MNVLVLSPGADTGGQGYRIAAAFGRHRPRWNVRAIHATDNYIKYPRDLMWERGDVLRRYRDADVVHWKNGVTLYPQYDQGLKKPTIVHHHGSRLRTAPKEVHREAASVGAVELVSTVDLLLDAPGSIWLPAPFDLQEMAKYRRTRPNPRVRIVHAPTNRRIKGTSLLLEACNSLARRKVEFELDIVENVSWSACLTRKGRADIYVDQLYLGYGNNAVEAWAMGIPVVAGVMDADVRALMLDTWGELPFVEASPNTLEAVLERLIIDASWRLAAGEMGLRHVQKYHDERVVVDQLEGIYRAAPPSKGAKFVRPAAKPQSIAPRALIPA